MRIVIADDDAVALELLGAALAHFGHEVDAVGDGAAALEILRRGEHQAVICDWEMPGLSGPDLCRALRRDAGSGYVYAILLTGRDADADEGVVEGLDAGADDFIVKPFKPRELAVRLKAAERILATQTRDLTIFALAKLAESRDPETGAHLERVRSYCMALAEDLSGDPALGGEVDAGFARLIYLTSPLHDIGKVGIPDCVLLKPGRLSDREFEIMRTHAELGAETLDAALREHPTATFLRMARDIAHTHHERWDGTGYPRRLAGEAIPLSGRIVAVADVYDALTSKRVYKAAMTHEIAKSIIVGDAGTHFDPRLVAAFLRCEPRFCEIRERFSEPSPAAARAA